MIGDDFRRRFSASACSLLLGVTSAVAGPAVNQFEVKDLESSPGDFEFQSQNAYSVGQPRRRFVDPPAGERVYDDNTVIRQREALEVQLGITDWLRVRVGIEYEQERLDDPATFAQAERFGPLKLDEIAFEGVVVLVPVKTQGIGLGLLVEYGHALGEGPEGQDELFVGPIIEARSGNWTAIANLTAVGLLGGKAEPGNVDYVRDDKIDFAYFLQLENRVSRSWAFAFEAYGTVDRIGSTGNASAGAELFGDMDQHRAGPVAYYTFFPDKRAATGSAGKLDVGTDDDDAAKELSVTIGAGALFGLNEHTPDATFKLSLEVDY